MFSATPGGNPILSPGSPASTKSLTFVVEVSSSQEEAEERVQQSCDAAGFLGDHEEYFVEPFLH